MGVLVFLSIGAVFISVLMYYVYLAGQPPELPRIEVTYWGAGKPKIDDETIKPFKISIPDEELNYLKEKLAATRPPVAPLEDSGFTYGTNAKYLETLVEVWKTKYNWRQREARMNSLPQYTTQIGGLNIHFLHVKPDPVKAKGKEVLPLLLLHGWPGSVLEFYQLIPLLTTPREDADYVFEVVAPSLPGYGFSQPASKKGLGLPQVAAIFVRLMDRLGFDRYYLQGGDWGSAIGTVMSVLFPQKVLAFHSNFCVAMTTASRFRALLAYLFPQFFMEARNYARYRDQFIDTYFLEMGYFHIQATKPDTVGVALTDSPVGLAAYLIEKFSTWTNRTFRNLPDGGLDYYSKIELLDFINLYWFTKTITPSMRLYSEAVNKRTWALGVERHPVKVPMGCALFESEMLYFPRMVLEGSMHNLLSLTELPKGGHFAAFEQPKLLADDLWNFIKIYKKWKTSTK